MENSSIINMWFCWFCTSQSAIFHLCRDRSSWVEPVLSKDKMCLAQGHNAVTRVRLEPAIPQSWIKHSTTEPMRSHKYVIMANMLCLCLTSQQQIRSYGDGATALGLIWQTGEDENRTCDPWFTRQAVYPLHHGGSYIIMANIVQSWDIKQCELCYAVSTKTSHSGFNFAYWEILQAFFDVCWFFFFFQNQLFLKNSFRKIIRVSNSLDPDQARHFV